MGVDCCLCYGRRNSKRELHVTGVFSFKIATLYTKDITVRSVTHRNKLLLKNGVQIKSWATPCELRPSAPFVHH